MVTSVAPAMPDETAPTSHEIALAIRNVSKAFAGGTRVLDDVSLDIRSGEFFSLLGPSGCGKTTLLRIIGGFEEPDSGSVLIGGRNVVHEPPYRRSTNMIFQHLALFPHLTVAENIAFGLEMKGTPRPLIKSKIREALELVQLPGFADRHVQAMSGGQKQRIAIARALVNDPDVLLLDEPLGALDLRLRLQMQEELRRIQRATGRTFIFVTHDQGEAITMSDRIAVMSGGKVVQCGTPQEIYETPTCRFVAEFIGNSNFLEGKVESVTADGLARIQAQGIEFVGNAPQGVEAGDATAVVLRYEKVEVLPVAHPAEPSDVEGVVKEETYMGPTIRYHIEVDGGAFLLAECSNTGRELGIRPESRVRLRWAVSSIVILNR